MFSTPDFRTRRQRLPFISRQLSASPPVTVSEDAIRLLRVRSSTCRHIAQADLHVGPGGSAAFQVRGPDGSLQLPGRGH